MKKFLTLTIVYILTVLCTLPCLSVKAVRAKATTTGEYACVLVETAFFYASPNEQSGLFLLPASYYVKVLNYGEDYCQIEYLFDGDKVKKLIGYAKTSTLTFVEYTPAEPYLYHLFDVVYRIDEDSLNNSAFLNEIRLTCAYYGEYKIGSKTYCYVLRDGAFGYIPKPSSLRIPYNTEHERWIAQQTPAASDAPLSPEEKASSSPAQIAILVALCLLVPVLAALILKPPRRPPYDTDG